MWHFNIDRHDRHGGSAPTPRCWSFQRLGLCRGLSPGANVGSVSTSVDLCRPLSTSFESEPTELDGIYIYTLYIWVWRVARGAWRNVSSLLMTPHVVRYAMNLPESSRDTIMAHKVGAPLWRFSSSAISSRFRWRSCLG